MRNVSRTTTSSLCDIKRVWLRHIVISQRRVHRLLAAQIVSPKLDWCIGLFIFSSNLWFLPAKVPLIYKANKLPSLRLTKNDICVWGRREICMKMYSIGFRKILSFESFCKGIHCQKHKLPKVMGELILVRGSKKTWQFDLKFCPSIFLSLINI